jgi:hypothetical protein
VPIIKQLLSAGPPTGWRAMYGERLPGDPTGTLVGVRERAVVAWAVVPAADGDGDTVVGLVVAAPRDLTGEDLTDGVAPDPRPVLPAPEALRVGHRQFKTAFLGYAAPGDNRDDWQSLAIKATQA